MEHVADGFVDTYSLSHLALAGESLNDAAAREVSDLAASGRLVSLDIARTALVGAGTVMVTHALSKASGLTYLDMSNNSFGEEAARELAKALAGGVDGGVSPGKLFAVRCLRLARCNLGPMGGAAVARALSANSSVEELDLSDNGLGAAAGEALAMSLRVLYRNDIEVGPACVWPFPLASKIKATASLYGLCQRMFEHRSYCYCITPGLRPMFRLLACRNPWWKQRSATCCE